MPSRVDDPHVAVDELRVADRAEQRLELVRVPAVVLVGERDEARRSAGTSDERALEVAVEAEPPRRARDDEARVAADRASRMRGEALGRASSRR